MSTWTAPESSSPPSTPDYHSRSASSHGNPFASFAPHPSTTPAGPPPSSARSFTPVGPPPPSVFGSPQLGPGDKLFSSKPSFGPSLGSSKNSVSFAGNEETRNNFAFSTQSDTAIGFKQGPRGNTFAVPSSSPPSGIGDDDSGDGPNGRDEHGESNYVSEGSEQDSMEFDSDAERRDRHNAASTSSYLHRGHQSTGSPFGNVGERPTSDVEPPRSTKRSRGGNSLSYSSSHGGKKALTKKKDSALPGLARDVARQHEEVSLDEPDELILGTEELVNHLYPAAQSLEEQERTIQAALVAVPEALSKLWQSCCDREYGKPTQEDYAINIGPDEHASPMCKASFLGNLLLCIHHPPGARGKQAFAAPRSNRLSSFSSSTNAFQTPARPTAFPKVVLDWLDEHHNPYRAAMTDLRTTHPNPTAYLNYWDIIFSTILRGKLADVRGILKESDFRYARTARDDGYSQDGYQGSQLGNIDRVINRAIQVLELCPALQSGDWAVTDNDWTIFRKRIEQAIDDLATFAEGRDRDLDPTESTFEAENFGITNPDMTLSRTSRRAQSKVPWTIYQNLKAMYRILLGGATEIISVAQDWLEATIGLTAWWDGDDDAEIAIGSLSTSRRSTMRSQSRVPRSVDADTIGGYLRRMAYAFERVTDDNDDEAFQINPMNQVEVGIASILEGDVEGVISMLRCWSLPIASAVMEVASQAGWFEASAGGRIVDGFNESDLMVLSYGQSAKEMDRDNILIQYAEELFKKSTLDDPKAKTIREGWELAMQILTRLDDSRLAKKKIAELLNQLQLHSEQRVDKLLDVCNNLGMAQEAYDTAERYANSIAEGSNRYGTALIYYARAHNGRKVKNVLDLLISYSLVGSLAYPPSSDLDNSLKSLVFSPKHSLTQIAELDSEAAELLQTYLSGYATLRQFYDLRDEEKQLKEGQKPSLRPLARKKAAAAALLAVINSAADNIYGGLYDENRGAVVPVDGLLALLGEALVFVDQPKAVLTMPQTVSLLKAVEDLQTVTARVYAQCEECFQATIAAAHGSQPSSSPRALLKKGISSMTSSSGFSLMGSSIMEHSTTSANGSNRNGGQGSMGSSGVLVPGGDEGKRGWDWRMGFGTEVRGDDVLAILRLGLAKEVARAWVEGGEA
ncbi:MAG: hypothetical protein FRX48_00393 [Lasallia pustulata]|uniref:Nuclear pore complex protein Nup85 n=1 Tax=Lasallia pustulata TaxID=136370 RepID=A0A5M8Q389_9LECA|nr:MAG: hypothetical protein FRX48_00393 [Lasallia pustulata]